MFAALIQGLLLGGGLIIAIGAQNAHVLRMGLRREHVLLTVVICALCDSLLIALGVAGVGTLVAAHPLLLEIVTYGGAAFLAWYGWRALHSAMAPGHMDVNAAGRKMTVRQAVTTVLAFSLMNPHALLDTVVLVGSVGGQYMVAERFAFGAGAVLASWVWFFALGFGARLLVPVFEKPMAWRVLDSLIAVVMFALAAMLLLG